MAEIGDGVELRISSRKDRRVRNRRQRRLGIRLFENNSLAGQGVEIGRNPALGTEETHPVGARRIHSDEDDVGGFPPGAG